MLFVAQGKGFTNDRCWQNFGKIRSENVQNLDLLPTLIEYVTDSDRLQNLRVRQQLMGASLCRPLSDRVLIQLNTNQIRHWTPEGFGLVYRNYRYVFTNTEGEQLFNVATDPNEMHSLITNGTYAAPVKELKTRFESFIRQNLELKRVWDSALEAHR